MSTSQQTVISDLPEWQKRWYESTIPGQEGILQQLRPALERQQQIAAGYTGDPGALAPWRQTAGVSQPWTSGAEASLQAGIGGWADNLSSAQGFFGLGAGALGMGTEALQRSFGAGAQFPGAYGQMQDAAGIAGLMQGQIGGALGTASASATGAQDYLSRQNLMLREMPADIREQLTNAATRFESSLLDLSDSALTDANTSRAQIQAALQQAGGDTNRALQALQAQGLQLNQLPADARERLTQAAQSQSERLSDLERRTFGQTDLAQRQAQEAIARGRDIAGTAAERLLGAGGMYDPAMTQGFMDPYQRNVVEAQQREMQRLADIQRQDIRAQAVGAGAFGGSREAVQQAELTRNLMEQQSRIAAELMSQGYTQAQANSMAAFESAQQRQMQGASGAGHIGLSAEELAATTGLQGSQIGLQGIQQAMQSAQFLAQQGLSAEEIAARTGLSAQQIQQAGILGGGQLGQSMGQLGAQGAASGAQIGQQVTQQAMQAVQFLAQMGLSAQEIAAQTGLSAAQIEQAGTNLYGQMGLNLGQAGMQGAQITGQQADLMRQLGLGTGALGAQEAEIFRQGGLGMGALSEQMGMLGGRQLQAADMYSTLGGRDVSRQLGMGEYLRGVQQQGLDTQFENQMRQWSMPMQQIGWQADILRGVPTGQSTLTQVSQPQQGWGTQAAAAGITMLGMGGFGGGFGGGGGGFGF